MNRTGSQRGFALLIVMMLVALVGLGAAALLDLVNVDIGIAAVQRKSVEAESASVGAVLETIGDANFARMLPQLDDADLRTALVERQSDGTYVIDPDGVVATRVISPAESAFIEAPGGYSEDGYESDVRLVRIIPRQNSSHTFAVAVYEVRARASISGGEASREARSLVYLPVAVRADRVSRQRHAR